MQRFFLTVFSIRSIDCLHAFKSRIKANFVIQRNSMHPSLQILDTLSSLTCIPTHTVEGILPKCLCLSSGAKDFFSLSVHQISAAKFSSGDVSQSLANKERPKKWFRMAGLCWLLLLEGGNMWCGIGNSHLDTRQRKGRVLT